MTKLSQLGSIAILLTGLLGHSGALGAEGGSVSGTVRQFGARVIEPSVALTSYADKNCAALAERKDRSKSENDLLAVCRKEKIRTMKGDRVGLFELSDLTGGWYSLTIIWPQGNVPIWCSKPSPPGWVIKHVQADDLIHVVAESSPFELKATDKMEKDLDWCR
jgi:hypothetical protein